MVDVCDVDLLGDVLSVFNFGLVVSVVLVLLCGLVLVVYV